MQTISKGCLMIVCLTSFILFLFYFANFQRTRNYDSNETKQQLYNFDLINNANRNRLSRLHTKAEKYMDLNTIIKGKGSYKLEHPKGTKQGEISWSQYGQDQVIDKLLKKKKNGFFVEIGGYDGESMSNTLFFEKERNWNGLLVEASPFLYDMMLKKDRKCYMVNACISKSLPAMTFMLAGAITSAKETLTDRHHKRIDKERIAYGKDKHWAHVNDTVKVNCFPLLTIMRTIRRKDIDYFSLDVEGAEMHILNSIEWDDLNIDVFTIETDQHRNEILSFMKQKGYKWIQKLLGDDIFQKIR
ncbi:protein Star-like [Mytilus edulis]|uniref:protein Star-like n=1 Tax=Mytilus edulis TaxID=6550 RepID=UPI0039EF1198